MTAPQSVQSQLVRVLAVLRARGDRGTHRLEWAGPDVVDGGPPILHLGGRINDLRRAGVGSITTRPGPHRVALYVLEHPNDEGAASLVLDVAARDETDAMERCACARALPRPCADGELRCARCERPANGWQW